jgi:membrane protease subunit HflC
VQILEDQPEQQQTKDAFSVIVNSYLAWRIARPLDFFRALQNEPAAEAQLLSRLRDAKSIIGEYTFDELTNPDQQKLKLQQIEQGILKRLQDQIDVQKYGIKIEAVGIKRIALPEEVTKKVFARMRATRERLAQRARSEGDAVANGIRSQAQSSADRILAFAKLRAEAIRGEGDLAAAKYYEVFRQNPSFAAYRLQVETLKQTLQHNTTFLLDTQTPPFDLFKMDEKPAPKRAD